MSLSLEQLIDVLAQSSGDERAARLVDEECARLRIRSPPVGADLVRVTDELSQRAGAVGASIRLALRRANPARSTSRGHTVVPAGDGGSGAHQISAGDRLIELLAPALGKAQARHIVASTSLELGFDPDALSPEQSHRILERLSSRDDYVAAVARFAKVKTLLGA